MHRTNMNDSLFDNELCAKQVSAEKIEVFKKIAKGKQLQNLINSDVYLAQEISQGDGVNIAIINSGVDWNHPEISTILKSAWALIIFA